MTDKDKTMLDLAAEKLGLQPGDRAALCNAQGINQDECAEAELARVWTKVEQIRAKQAAKPKHSPLPVEVSNVNPTAAQQDSEDAKRYRYLCEFREWPGDVESAFDCATKVAIDEAIDAAIQAKKS